MIVYLASDHAGFEMKESIREAFDKGEFGGGYAIVDCGADHFKDGDDYPSYMARAAEHVSEDAEHNPSLAILFGGSGAGEAIVANRFPFVRAIVYQGADMSLVALGKEHNDANVLSVGARFVSLTKAKEAISLFLSTPFSHDERHSRRIIDIEDITTTYFSKD